jgi:hypothetical protein
MIYKCRDQRQKMTQYALLNQLSSGKDWKVRIRISRMWDAVNSNNNEFISLDMILIDEQVCFSFKNFNMIVWSYMIFVLNVN